MITIILSMVMCDSRKAGKDRDTVSVEPGPKQFCGSVSTENFWVSSVLRALKRTQNRTSFWHQNYELQFAVRSYALCKELRIYRLIEVQTSPLIAHRTHN